MGATCGVTRLFAKGGCSDEAANKGGACCSICGGLKDRVGEAVGDVTPFGCVRGKKGREGAIVVARRDSSG